MSGPAAALPAQPLRVAGQVLRQTVVAWLDDRCASKGASLAFYTLFSLAPLLLIVVSIAGLLFGEEAARGQVFAQLQHLIGPSGAAAVQDLLLSVQRPAGGLMASALGLALMLVGATTVVNELQSTLDAIWSAREPSGSGWRRLLRTRLMSLSLILGVGFLLVVSLLADAALAAAQRWWAPWFGAWLGLARVVDLVLGYALMTTLFAMIYKLMPRVRIAWKDVWLGALATTLLFDLGRHAIALYVTHGAVSSGFGAAGSLVAVMSWVYYSAQIFLLGAEFTWVVAHRFGSRRHLRAGPAGTAPASPGAVA